MEIEAGRDIYTMKKQKANSLEPRPCESRDFLIYCPFPLSMCYVGRLSASFKAKLCITKSCSDKEFDSKSIMKLRQPLLKCISGIWVCTIARNHDEVLVLIGGCQNFTIVVPAGLVYLCKLSDRQQRSRCQWGLASYTS